MRKLTTWGCKTIAESDHSMAVDQRCREKVEQKAHGKDSKGWLVIGMIGPPIHCRICAKERWNDGTKCWNCGNYQRADLPFRNREAAAGIETGILPHPNH